MREAFVEDNGRLFVEKHIDKSHTHRYVSEVASSSRKEINRPLFAVLRKEGHLKSVGNVKLAILFIGHYAHKHSSVFTEPWRNLVAQVVGGAFNGFMCDKVCLMLCLKLGNACVKHRHFCIKLSRVARARLKRDKLVFNAVGELVHLDNLCLEGGNSRYNFVVVNRGKCLSLYGRNLCPYVDFVFVGKRAAYFSYGKLRGILLLEKQTLALKEGKHACLKTVEEQIKLGGRRLLSPTDDNAGKLRFRLVVCNACRLLCKTCLLGRACHTVTLFSCFGDNAKLALQVGVAIHTEIRAKRFKRTLCLKHIKNKVHSPRNRSRANRSEKNTEGNARKHADGNDFGNDGGKSQERGNHGKSNSACNPALCAVGASLRARFSAVAVGNLNCIFNLVSNADGILFLRIFILGIAERVVGVVYRAASRTKLGKVCLARDVARVGVFLDKRIVCRRLCLRILLQLVKLFKGLDKHNVFIAAVKLVKLVKHIFRLCTVGFDAVKLRLLCEDLLVILLGFLKPLLKVVALCNEVVNRSAVTRAVEKPLHLVTDKRKRTLVIHFFGCGEENVFNRFLYASLVYRGVADLSDEGGILVKLAGYAEENLPRGEFSKRGGSRFHIDNGGVLLV